MVHLRGYLSDFDNWSKPGRTAGDHDSGLPLINAANQPGGRDPLYRGTDGLNAPPPAASAEANPLSQASLDGRGRGWAPRPTR